MPERILDPVCVFNHIVNYQSTVMEKGQKQRMAFIGISTFRYWKLLLLCIRHPDVANLIGKTFASVSSSDSYSPAFQATKNRLERTPINFRCRQPLPYNCDFDMFELKRALSSAHNTSPGPDGISYVLLRHLSADSLVSLLYLFNRIWREQVYPTQWQEAIVIPILKPEKILRTLSAIDR
ncbi:putative RNA-directed DNA polymerase from transposon X-element [Trichonephila clavipes]|nr:putative RNA-directed DNA polymerase from transposon X-element [Trichonephila clavipes]